MKTILTGAHVSIQGGFDKAVERGTLIGARVIQIFTKSNRQWYAKTITQKDIDSYQNALKYSDIQEVVVHAPYLINLCSASPETQKKSIDGLITEIERCHALSIKYLVLHPGSNPDQDAAIELASKNLEHVLSQTKDSKVTVLLETMAGQGDSIGSLEQLHNIRKNIQTKSRVAYCLDTCHAFACGHSFTTKKEYAAFKKELEKTLDISLIKVIHINDSKKALASHVDRHEHIGKGKIGLEAFEHIMNDIDFKMVPKILETPKEHDPQDDIKNLATLASLVKK